MKLFGALILMFIFIATCGRNDASTTNNTINLVLLQNKQNTYKPSDGKKITKLDTTYVKVGITFLKENNKKYFIEKYHIPIFGHMVKKTGSFGKIEY